ncbi:MAG: right-handed parallel beta-helix repeat-containing protein [Planctomycetota bacterium]
MLEFVFLVTCLHGAPGAAVVGDYYVDPAGNDQNPGTKSQPFLTLARARDEVRKRIAGGLPCDLSVVLREGTYELSYPVVFGPEDSGDDLHSVSYIAEPGERPVLSGGRKIEGWKKGSGEVWTCQIPAQPPCTFRSLFVNGQRRTRARSPNAGFFRIDGTVSQAKPLRFRYREGDIRPEWAASRDVEVVAFFGESSLRITIREVLPEERTVVLAGDPEPWLLESGARYYVENAPDALDAPGEWILDAKAGKVSYWPLPGEDLEGADVVAPRVAELVRIEGETASLKLVKNLHFLGISFAHTDWTSAPGGFLEYQVPASVGAAFELKGAANCSIERCEFRALGTHAVELGAGAKKILIVGNRIADVGAGAVRIGTLFRPAGDDDLAAGNVVSDNHISHCGQVTPSAPAIWIGESGDNAVANNEIEFIAGTGIWVGTAWGYKPGPCKGNEVRFNHLRAIGLGPVSGSSGIFTRGAQPGTAIHDNVVHDVGSPGYGGWGIHLGPATAEVLVENNIVYRSKAAGFQIHSGRGNVVRNNVFAMNSESQLSRLVPEEHVALAFERNVIYWSEGNLLSGRWDDGKFAFDKNVYWRTGGREVLFGTWKFAEWQRRGHDANSLIADPLFVRVSAGDFSLRRESPAAAVGFREIGTALVGPREEYRIKVARPSGPPPAGGR